jgi:hypothetical protein
LTGYFIAFNGKTSGQMIPCITERPPKRNRKPADTNGIHPENEEIFPAVKRRRQIQNHPKIFPAVTDRKIQIGGRSGNLRNGSSVNF